MISFRLPLVAALLLVAGSAHGDEDPDVEIAKRHFLLGKKHYEARAYQKAIGEFEAAKLVKPLPALEFNIGRCYDRMEKYREAIVHYERFMNGTPDPFDADEARQRIRVLRERLAILDPSPKPEPPPSRRPVEKSPRPTIPAAAPVATPRAPPPEPRGPPAEGRRRLPLAVPLVVGVAALGAGAAGLGLVLSVGPDYDRLAASCRPSCSTAEVDGLRTRAWAGYALFGLAGAAAITDGLLFWLYARAPAAPRLAVAPLPEGALVPVGGRF